MTNTNITNLRKNLFEYIDQAVNYNDVINVNTKNGNAVIISEKDYNSLMETLYLSSVPGLVDKIKDGLNTSISECVPEDKVEW